MIMAMNLETSVSEIGAMCANNKMSSQDFFAFDVYMLNMTMV